MVSQKPQYCKNFERNCHWRKLSMIMVWERYHNASPKPKFFLFSLFIFSFISQLIWHRLGWNFHRWFSIQKKVNWCTIAPFSLKFCTSQHSYPVPLKFLLEKSMQDITNHFRQMQKFYFTGVNACYNVSICDGLSTLLFDQVSIRGIASRCWARTTILYLPWWQ